MQELIPKPQNIHVIGNSQIAPDLIFFDIGGVNNDNDFCIVGKLHQHAQLGIGRKAGKHAGSMVIVKKLSAELQIKLVAELVDAFLDVLGLHFQIFFVVKTGFHLLPFVL